MPRRYRSPTGRRKQKKRRDYQEAAAPDREPHSAPAPAPALRTAADDRSTSRPVHILRDHSHVLTDIKVIALLALAISVGMVLTAIFR